MPMTDDGGYIPPDTIYKLVFEDHPGLVVRAASVPFGVVLELMDMADQVTETTSIVDRERPADVAKAGTTIIKLFDQFVMALQDWNLRDRRGEPVPATLEGLHTQHLGFVLEIILAWLAAMAQVPDPLARRYSAGRQSAEPSIPMETLSANPGNSPGPN